MDLEKKFKEFVAEKKLFAKSDKIILAVSGGVDSVVMAELFYRSGISFGVAHCNFQLRGDESNGDEDFVKKLAEKYKVPFFVRRFETKVKSKNDKLSVQERARKQRYDWFAELIAEHGYDFVATAHHLNDSIETFFINLLRGTGISGMRGIPLKLNKTVRPMLFAKKDELENFAAENKLHFRLDHSNETDLYFRNKLRHHLMPVLLQLNPQFEKVMERTLRNLAFAEEMMKKQLRGKFPLGKNSDDADELKIEKEDLGRSEFPSETLMALLQIYGFNASQAEDAWSSKTGSQFFSGDYVLTSDRRQFILNKKKNQPDPQISISPKDKKVKSGKLKLSFTSKKRSNGSDLIAGGSKNYFMVDRQLLDFPLVIRKWKSGDSFYPLGMKGKKKISDFLTDRKVSRPDKEKTYVLLSGDQIVCVLGHRIDERYKVTKQTKEIYGIELNDE